jgi:NAD(P)H-dependent FMN reductase
MSTRKVGVIVGSTRRESINRKLAEALVKLVPGDLRCEILRIDDLPVFNQDDEKDPVEAVARLRQKVAEADGILFVTPEHNRSLPTALKNALDWASRVSLVKHAASKISHRGSITFTSGISKDKPGPSGGSVVAAVAGSMTYLVRALALELAPVRVNVVSPGWVETPMWDDIVAPAKVQMWEDMGKRLPAGRVAKPVDIAQATFFC